MFWHVAHVAVIIRLDASLTAEEEEGAQGGGQDGSNLHAAFAMILAMQPDAGFIHRLPINWETICGVSDVRACNLLLEGAALCCARRLVRTCGLLMLNPFGRYLDAMFCGCMCTVSDTLRALQHLGLKRRAAPEAERTEVALRGQMPSNCWEAVLVSASHP